jgi:hypothetical protein
MIFAEVAGLLILAGATWLVMNRPESGDGVRHRRLTTAMLTAGGVVVTGTLLTAAVIAL